MDETESDHRHGQGADRGAASGPTEGVWEAFFQAVPHGVVVLRAVRNERGRLRDFEWVDVNPVAEAILRAPAAELVGQRLRSVYPDHLDPRLMRRLATAMVGRKAREFEYAVPAPAGRARDGDAPSPEREEGPPTWWFAVTLVPTDDQHLVVLFRSITDYKDVLRQAVQLMNHDDLTGLANRRHLKSRFWVWRKRRMRMALIFFDLNGFKVVNDLHGHETGDRVLGVIGQRLKQNVRPHEMVARIGGDEFAVLLRDADVGTLDRVAGRLIQAVEEPVHLQEHTVQLSASVGVALYPDDADSFEGLLGCADERMYRHKRQRRESGRRA
ncbi:MAG TPA: diguanylate cyclase [Trueperaceae bacterium]|nr:diguanylate cyclase [Trueperaceae bacterium]